MDASSDKFGVRIVVRPITSDSQAFNRRRKMGARRDEAAGREEIAKQILA
jgi:hypothetical protein